VKILYLDDIPTPYRLGIHRRISAIHEYQYQVVFCASEEPGRTWELDFTGIEYRVLTGWKCRPPGQVNPFSYKLNMGVTKLFSDYRPDVVVLSGYVHPTMWLAASWCRRNGIPYGVTSESSTYTESKSRIKKWVKSLMMRPVVRGAAFGLPVSGAAGDQLREMADNKALPIFMFPNTPDITLIQEVINTSQGAIRDRSFFEKLGVPTTGKIILFVGRLIDAKRPLDLLNAYKLLPERLRQEIHIVFVGDGPLRKKIHSQIDEYDSIFDIGWISDYPMLVKLMASADLFVLPSSHEPWGTVVNEAMACSLPVLVSDHVGAGQEMINHNVNGFIFPCGQVKRIAELIELFILSSTQQKYKEAARKTAREFGEEFAVKNLMDALSPARMAQIRSKNTV
jgi:glycosyltransferase involved in cell wall biosynthesis